MSLDWMIFIHGSHPAVTNVSTLCSPRIGQFHLFSGGGVGKVEKVAHCCHSAPTTPPPQTSRLGEPTHRESGRKIMQTRSSNQSNAMQRRALRPLDRAPIDSTPKLHDWDFIFCPGLKLGDIRYQILAVNLRASEGGVSESVVGLSPPWSLNINQSFSGRGALVLSPNPLPSFRRGPHRVSGSCDS